MSRLSTHVLDTSRGQPAAGIAVVLELATPEGWKVFGQGVTDADGRVTNLLPEMMPLASGDYRLRFATAGYFQSLGIPSFIRKFRSRLALWTLPNVTIFRCC